MPDVYRVTRRLFFPFKKRKPVLSIIIVVIALGVITQVSFAQATLPTGFVESVIATDIDSPTTMAIAPDGRIFVLEQDGDVRIVENDVLLPTPFMSLTVNSASERGLLGITFDPNFATNNYIYVYYTVPAPLHNRVSRFTANGNTVLAGSEVVLLDLEPLNAGNHNGGAMHFGPDGRLYIAVGENAESSNAQLLTNRLGKILRVNSDGSIPGDNPLLGSTSGVNQAIWAYGLRNPYNFAFDPATGSMYINDVGQSNYEEINEGIAGSNYGWPTTEGETTDPNFVSPIFAYPHGSGTDAGCAIVGAAFYRGSQFPADYFGDYFFADYCNDWIKHYDSATDTATLFATTTVGGLVDIRIAQDGSLYYLARGSGGQLIKVEYTTPQAPVITSNPLDATVAEGDSATFSCTASGTAPVAIQWQRDGVDILGATANDYTIPVTVVGDDGATFRCVASNTQGSATSTAATLTVVVGGPPTGVITAPINGTNYNGGDGFTFSGTGTDPEDGVLGPAAFTWWADLHHDTHTHPFIPETSGIDNGTFTIPTVGHTETNVWYRLYLRVTDSTGLTHESYVEIFPNLVQFTVDTDPTGFQVTVDGVPYAAPVTIDSVVGIQRSLVALSPQTGIGPTMYFSEWDDGSTSATRVINVPAVNTDYLATYTDVAPPVVDDGSSGSDDESDDDDDGTNPALTVGDPAISKIGFLLPGQVGVTGEKLEWIVTVTNNGAVPLTNVNVTDTLVDALQVDRVSTPKGTVNISGQTVTVSFATLSPGEMVRFSIFTTVLDGVNVNNTACIESSGIEPVCASSPVISSLPGTGETPHWVYRIRMLRNVLFAAGFVMLGLRIRYQLKQ